MGSFDFKLVSRLVFIGVLAVLLGAMFTSMIRLSNQNMDKQAEKVREIIEKALVQCYALEGSYPSDASYLTKYGVIIDEEKFIYHLDYLGSNVKPGVQVVAK